VGPDTITLNIGATLLTAHSEKELAASGRRPGHEDQEHARARRVLGQVVLGDLMLALTGLTVDHRNAVRLRGRTVPPGEATGDPRL
jgi:hypothetical protein